MSRAVLGIGANLGDRRAALQQVLDGLSPVVRACSSVYSTAPWGGVEQQDFLNAVLVVDDPARGPWEWLHTAQELERAAHRVRGQRWGPRTLDVDVLDCDGTALAERTGDGLELVLPHPRAHERAFVLVPWAEVDPAARLVGRGPVTELLAALADAERDGVRRRDELALVLGR